MRQWVVKYRALFAADGKPFGEFTVEAIDMDGAKTKAQQAISAKSKELGVDAFGINISEKEDTHNASEIH